MDATSLRLPATRAPVGPRAGSPVLRPHARCSRPAHGRKLPNGGFSLLEVLVAFVILALVATAIFRLFSGALGNVSAAEEYSRAVLLAESLLDGAAANTLRAGTETGSSEDGSVQWRVEVAPYDAPDVNPDLERASAALPTRLYRLVATVTFPGLASRPRSIALSTLRIGAREVP